MNWPCWEDRRLVAAAGHLEDTLVVGTAKQLRADKWPAAFYSTSSN